MQLAPSNQSINQPTSHSVTEPNNPPSPSANLNGPFLHLETPSSTPSQVVNEAKRFHGGDTKTGDWGMLGMKGGSTSAEALEAAR